MYCVPVYTCISSVMSLFFDVFSPNICLFFVFIRMEISLFNTGIVGSCGVFLLVMFLCAILLRMGYGRSWSVLRILPTGMCCFPAWYSMLVNVLFASCMSVGGCIACYGVGVLLRCVVCVLNHVLCSSIYTCISSVMPLFFDVFPPNICIFLCL